LNLSAEDILNDEFLLYNKLNHQRSLQAITDLLKDKIRQVFSYIAANREKNNALIDKAIEYIAQNIGFELNLETVANYLFLNPEYFSRLFKKQTGINFIDYVTKLKIVKAQEYLKDGRYKAAEVSKLVGYSDIKYFTRLFKKNAGMTPGNYKDFYANQSH